MKRKIAVFCGLLFAGCATAQNYDTVLARGRVMDPESGLDAVRDIGILQGKIAVISEKRLRGKDVIDVSGLVVAPGFIDLHSHGQDAENYDFKARDGVTTALEMEVGVNPVGEWYRARESKARINFGATTGHIPARMAVMGDSGTFLPRDRAVNAAATPEQLAEIQARVKRGFDDGALGVGLGIAYTPGATREEILAMFRIAAEHKAACFVHIRQAGPVEPGVVNALQEVLADAAITGAGLHVVHLTSMALAQTALALEIVHGARSHGLDVTTEIYPYTAGMTGLETAIFDTDWQARLGIGFGDLQWVATGERLTAATFERYRKEGGMVIIHSIPETAVRLGMSDRDVMVASDGILQKGKGHPRGSGTYARTLGRYVREQHALSLMDALRKMSLLPAQRLETVSAAMHDKGRIRVGADADLTVFDAARVRDESTYENPERYSSGIPYVLVKGKLVVRGGDLVRSIFPGQAIRSH